MLASDGLIRCLLNNKREPHLSSACIPYRRIPWVKTIGHNVNANPSADNAELKAYRTAPHMVMQTRLHRGARAAVAVAGAGRTDSAHRRPTSIVSPAPRWPSSHRCDRRPGTCFRPRRRCKPSRAEARRVHACQPESVHAGGYALEATGLSPRLGVTARPTQRDLPGILGKPRTRDSSLGMTYSMKAHPINGWFISQGSGLSNPIIAGRP